jgi:hypothetical protein
VAVEDRLRRGADDYIAFRTMGKSLLKEQTLSEVETQLDRGDSSGSTGVSAEHRADRAEQTRRTAAS